MTREDSINKFFDGRYFMIIMFVLFILSTFAARLLGKAPMQGSYNGVCFSSASALQLQPHISTILNIVGVAAIGTLMFFLNKVYSFIRAVTLVYVSTFLMQEIANPYLSVRFFDGTLLCLVTLVCIFILFSSYQTFNSQRRIYLTFTILSFFCTIQYAFLYLIPVFMVGFIQMRAMSFRSLLAMIFGIITPYWFLFGTGIIPIYKVMPPHWENIFSNLDLVVLVWKIGATTITVLIALVLLAMNSFHILNYRMQIRAYNGFWVLLTICTVIIMIIDNNNWLVYMPLVNCCMAIQVAHTFTISKYSKRYIFMILLIIESFAASFI